MSGSAGGSRRSGNPAKRAAAHGGSPGAAAGGSAPVPRSEPSLLGDLAILIGAIVVASGIAGLAGATNLGTALAFGQIGFVLALLYVLLRR